MMQMSFKAYSLLIFLLLSINKSAGLSIENILQTSSIEQLQTFLTNEKSSTLIHFLCEKQKKEKTIPTACYQLSKKASETDLWCLHLKTSDLQVNHLAKTLRTKTLSPLCKNHLEKSLKLLIYRKKDFLLPELRNHWTDESSFL